MGDRLVRMAARSPARSITGPEVDLIPTPNSWARMLARVVFPRPGGPCTRTWSRASPRAMVAVMAMIRLRRASACPTNSSRVLGLSPTSRPASSGPRRGLTSRSSSSICRHFTSGRRTLQAASPWPGGLVLIRYKFLRGGPGDRWVPRPPLKLPSPPPLGRQVEGAYFPTSTCSIQPTQGIGGGGVGEGVRVR